MKKILLSVVLMLSFAMVGSAQKKLFVYNNTGCSQNFYIFADAPNSYPTPGGYAHAGTYVAPALSSISVDMSTASWDQGGSSVPADPSWIWGFVRIWDPNSCTSLLGDGQLAGTDMGQDVGFTSMASSTDTWSGNTGCNGGCSSFYATWTDLGNGDVRIDIW